MKETTTEEGPQGMQTRLTSKHQLSATTVAVAARKPSSGDKTSSQHKADPTPYLQHQMLFSTDKHILSSTRSGVQGPTLMARVRVRS